MAGEGGERGGRGWPSCRAAAAHSSLGLLRCGIRAQCPLLADDESERCPANTSTTIRYDCNMTSRRTSLQQGAAAKAGFSERSGRRIEQASELPSQRKKPRVLATPPRCTKTNGLKMYGAWWCEGIHRRWLGHGLSAVAGGEVRPVAEVGGDRGWTEVARVAVRGRAGAQAGDEAWCRGALGESGGGM
jgi:hypothetical protein